MQSNNQCQIFNDFIEEMKIIGIPQQVENLSGSSQW